MKGRAGSGYRRRGLECGVVIWRGVCRCRDGGVDKVKRIGGDTMMSKEGSCQVFLFIPTSYRGLVAKGSRIS